MQYANADDLELTTAIAGVSLTSTVSLLCILSLRVNTNAALWYSADGLSVKWLWWWKLSLSFWFIHSQSKPFITYLIKPCKICMMFLHIPTFLKRRNATDFLNYMVSGIMSVRWAEFFRFNPIISIKYNLNTTPKQICVFCWVIVV